MSACRQEFVVNKKLLSEDRYADAIALAWMMPGPVASNVAVRLGAMMRGLPGAVAMGIGAALPFFLALCAMAACYNLLEGRQGALRAAIGGFTPAACAVIMSAAIGQARSLFQGWTDAAIAALSLVAFLLLKTPLSPILVLAGAALIGMHAYRALPGATVASRSSGSEIGSAGWAACIAVACAAFVAGQMMVGTAGAFAPSLLLAHMAGVSLTLFGGGLIVIPILHDLLVSSLHWITDAEFYTAIASAQVAPGPLLSSVIFIGYRIDGLTGALIAFTATFVPPAALMLCAITGIHRLSGNAWFVRAMRGVRVAVVGLTVAAGLFVGAAAPLHWLSLAIFLAALFLLQRTRVPVAIVVPAAGFLGYVLF